MGRYVNGEKWRWHTLPGGSRIRIAAGATHQEVAALITQRIAEDEANRLRRERRRPACTEETCSCTDEPSQCGQLVAEFAIAGTILSVIYLVARRIRS